MTASPADKSVEAQEVQEQRPQEASVPKRRAKRISDNDVKADRAAAEATAAGAAAEATAAGAADSKGAPKQKRAKKGSGLPQEPTGIRYEESMRPERLSSGARTIMSWNVAGARHPNFQVT